MYNVQITIGRTLRLSHTASDSPPSDPTRTIRHQEDRRGRAEDMGGSERSWESLGGRGRLSSNTPVTQKAQQIR